MSPVVTTLQTEQDLLNQAREGDQEAFRQLVNRYEEQVAATVIGMLGPGEEAEDVGQEVFIRFYKSLKRFRGDSAPGNLPYPHCDQPIADSIAKTQKKQDFLFI